MGRPEEAGCGAILCENVCFAEKNGFRRSAGGRHKRQACSEKYTSIHANCRFFLPLAANSCQLPWNLSERVAVESFRSGSDQGADFLVRKRNNGVNTPERFGIAPRKPRFPRDFREIYAVHWNAGESQASLQVSGKSSVRPRNGVLALSSPRE